MVRAWHPDLIPLLDENRLAGLHLELHMMRNALEAGPENSWWRNIETQVWWGRPGHLVWLHELTVREMDRRLYNHKTPLKDVESVPVDLVTWVGLPEIPYKEDAVEWYRRDAADLYVKYSSEKRFDADGYPKLGFRYWRSGSIKLARREHEEWELHTVHRDVLRLCDDAVGEREQHWTENHKTRLRALLRQRGG